MSIDESAVCFVGRVQQIGDDPEHGPCVVIKADRLVLRAIARAQMLYTRVEVRLSLSDPPAAPEGSGT